jgi:hypothetical protein
LTILPVCEILLAALVNDYVENIVVVADILGGVGHNIINDF